MLHHTLHLKAEGPANHAAGLMPSNVAGPPHVKYHNVFIILCSISKLYIMTFVLYQSWNFNYNSSLKTIFDQFYELKIACMHFSFLSGITKKMMMG